MTDLHIPAVELMPVLVQVEVTNEQPCRAHATLDCSLFTTVNLYLGRE